MGKPFKLAGDSVPASNKPAAARTDSYDPAETVGHAEDDGVTLVAAGQAQMSEDSAPIAWDAAGAEESTGRKPFKLGGAKK